MESGPKSICYVATSFDMHSDFRFAHKQCPGLAQRGFNVCYYAQGEGEMNIGGAEIRGVPKAKSKIGQIMLPWKLLWRLRKQKCDAYHLSNTELMVIALLLKLLTRKRVVFDFREDYVEFVKLKPYLKGPVRRLVIGVTRLLVWLICKTMDGVIFGDEGVQESYTPIPADRMQFVHHFPIRARFSENPIPYDKRQYDVVYLGTMSRTGGIFVMLEALSILAKSRPDFKALLIGQPVHVEDEFDKFVAEHDLDKVMTLTGKIPYDTVPQTLRDARVGLIGLTNLPKFHKQSATKIFEYMSQGIPCVCVDLPPERRFMTDGREGLFVPTEDPQQMADAVTKILDDPALGAKMSRQAYETFLDKKYYAEHELDELAEFYRNLLARPRRGLFSRT